MIAASIIASIVSILVSLAAAGVTTYTTALGPLNQEVRNSISNFMTTLNDQMSKGKIKLSKLVSLLSSKNQNALMNYLYSNPVVTRGLDQLNQDAALINQYQSKIQAIESEIESYRNEMSALGYSQSHSGVKKEKEKRDELKNKISDAQNRYDNAINEMEKLNIGSSTVEVKPYTKDIDATTQNIKGGLTNA